VKREAREKNQLGGDHEKQVQFREQKGIRLSVVGTGKGEKKLETGNVEEKRAGEHSGGLAREGGTKKKIAWNSHGLALNVEGVSKRGQINDEKDALHFRVVARG